MADPRHLLYTDFDGKPLATPAPLLGRGLVDDRHLERVPDLAALADDATAHPHDRLYACLALTAWGEERGYRAVVAAAASPPWHGLPQGAADAESQPGAPFGSGVALALPRAPFGVLAAQVGISDASAARKGTEADRRAALRALVRVADREDFDDQLGAAIFTGPPHDLVHDVVAAVRRGLQRLDRRLWPPFDLPCQLVDILEPLLEVDEPTVLALVGEVLRRDHRTRTLGYVAFLVATGTTPAATALAAHIVAVGGPAIAERLAAARLR